MQLILKHCLTPVNILVIYRDTLVTRNLLYLLRKEIGPTQIGLPVIIRVLGDQNKPIRFMKKVTAVLQRKIKAIMNHLTWKIDISTGVIIIKDGTIAYLLMIVTTITIKEINN